MKFVSARRTALIVAVTGLLGACSTTYSLKEFLPADGAPKTAFVDIKQRAVLSGRRAGEGGTVVTCAEPSPDAMSSFASEIALDAKAKDSLAASLAISQQEAASFVGLRTQSIQLLRDAMYRLCEGYMAGALSAADYGWLSRRYQKNMVALLTIEQLTRVAQVPVIAHASQGMASASRTATTIQADLEEVDKIKARLEDDKKKLADELTEAQKLTDTDTSKEAKLKSIKQRQSDNQAALGRADEVRAALLEGLKSAKGLLASGGTTVQIITEGRDGRGTVTDTVANAIKDLTVEIIQQDDLGTLCFQLLAGARTNAQTANSQATSTLAIQCGRIIEARATADELRLEDAREEAKQRQQARESRPQQGAALAAPLVAPVASTKPGSVVGRTRSQFLTGESPKLDLDHILAVPALRTQSAPPAAAASSVAPTKKPGQ